LKVDGVTYTLELFLTCDLKCLTAIGGMNNFFNSKSTYRCFWCFITKADLANLNLRPDMYAFRTATKIKQYAEKTKRWAESTRKKNASVNGGIVAEALNDPC
jgi:hypothetical protein